MLDATRHKNMRDTVKQRATVVCQLGRRILLVSREGTRWSLPGGRPETGEDLRETAMRELMEETRLLARDMRYLFGFTGIHTCHHVFVATLADGDQPVPSNEITRCTWAKVAEVGALPVSTSTKGIVEVLTMASNGASRLPGDYSHAADLAVHFSR
ncbi:NUDIX domain-containing protein [Paraburkholderia sp. BL17N1]|uniref:NUDIX hydrolase n=1 Tax=Paraburkholderia sp. BL17N1 TaxID=1938798 RepID=UPI000F1EC7A7|nr:NUDIX domain-containing protein [Paraburkholderia sp. BL17N1]RKR45679.1 ADP-ribose pyrophosphatase YjhB (NUDIX family) [Paraburkholderia sp. BL17N1]